MTTPMYTSDGRVVGQIADGVYYTRRRKSIHQLRRPPSWAIDRSILLELSGAGVERVELHDTESGQHYTAQLSDFWRHGIRVNRGFGEQVALPLAWWRIDNRPSLADEQAERAERKAAQLSIWELAR